MNYEALVNRVESLPPLLDTAQLIRSLYADGIQNVDIVKLVKVIESDALLSANILHMINSPLYGFSKQINSVSQAVTLFGTQMIFGFVVRYSINAVVIANLRAYGVSNERFNEVCHLQSALVHEWYSKIDLAYAQFLTPLALIMESGKLILAKELASNAKIKEFSDGLKAAQNISLYENEIFNTSSYYISALLFEHWNFNPLYVEILKSLDFEHSNTQKILKFVDILDVVRLAVNVKSVFTQNSINEASAVLDEIGEDKALFLEAVAKIKQRSEK